MAVVAAGAVIRSLVRTGSKKRGMMMSAAAEQQITEDSISIIPLESSKSLCSTSSSTTEETEDVSSLFTNEEQPQQEKPAASSNRRQRRDDHKQKNARNKNKKKPVAFDPTKKPRKSSFRGARLSSSSSSSSSLSLTTAATTARRSKSEIIKVYLPGQTKPIKRQRSIQFDTEVNVREVRSTKSLVKFTEEFRLEESVRSAGGDSLLAQYDAASYILWFQPEEYEQIKHKTYKLINHIQRLREERSEHEHRSTTKKQYCTRGLEKLIDPDACSDERNAAEDAVLIEQHIQREDGTPYDDEIISKAYMSVSKHAKIEAIKRARDDALIADALLGAKFRYRYNSGRSRSPNTRSSSRRDRSRSGGLRKAQSCENLFDTKSGAPAWMSSSIKSMNSMNSSGEFANDTSQIFATTQPPSRPQRSLSPNPTRRRTVSPKPQRSSSSSTRKLKTKTGTVLDGLNSSFHGGHVHHQNKKKKDNKKSKSSSKSDTTRSGTVTPRRTRSCGDVVVDDNRRRSSSSSRKQ